MEIIIVLCIIIIILLLIIIAATLAQPRAKRLAELERAFGDLSKKYGEMKADTLSVIEHGIKTSSDTVQSSVSNGMKANSDAVKSTLTLYGEQVSRLTEGLDARMNAMQKTQEERLEQMRLTLDKSVSQLREENAKKLDEIRGAVDEKLEKTLNDRLSESFRLVSGQLEEVHKSLGEMQSLASGVGDLKKILSNVKTRGIFGEVQLSRILEQLLTKDQYAENIATKPKSRDVVEFAIKLPGKNDCDGCIYMPLDAKFPLDIYSALLDAYDSADGNRIDKAAKELDSVIKKNAKDIHDKYIEPPYTTDFAIMFLPTEGLYAEVVRRTGLIEAISRDYSVNVCGPSTIAAFLNSLQMGFRTLAVEKRSHEVWNLLGAIKTEFASFESVLISVKKKFESADTELDKLITTRTNAMKRKLKSVEELPAADARKILGTDDVSGGDGYDIS